MGPTRSSAALPATKRDETIAEARLLIEDLRDAALDGLSLARRYASLLAKVIDENCFVFETRPRLALVRLEAAR